MILETLTESLFKDDKGKPLKLHSYQVEIIRIIVYKEHARSLCWMATRAGKSFAVAIAIIISAIYKPGEKIRIIAPIGDQTKIIMNYIVQHLMDSKTVMDSLDIDITRYKAERLKRELSKKRITFKNNSEIMILSANITGKGASLGGHGGTLIIVDECERIPTEIIRNLIMRMLGDSPNAIAFFISNPVKMGYMYEKMADKSWHQLRIGWRVAVKEGRLTEQFVMERKAELTPAEFDIWYNSTYPEEMEDALLRWKWIEDAIKRKFKISKNIKKKYLGCDIAERGLDWTVVTSVIETNESNFIITDIKHWHKADTMITVGKILDVNRDFKADQIKVDAIGVGKGVYDRLKEQKYPAIEVKVGMNPTREKWRFTNLKAQYYWRLRGLFEEGRISIPNNTKLIQELRLMRYDHTSGEKTVILDPENKSPDFADSLMLACAEGTPVTIGYIEVGG